jgi:glycosyltransferase involved in cell wall biosynthesis
MTPTVDALIIAKDNEQTIARAVASVRERVERVLVVVDPVTKDGTRERALEAGAQVEEAAPFVDFATARNDAIERARADYVVMVDSDDALAFTSAFRGWPSDSDAYSLRVVEGSYRWTRVLYFRPSLRFKGRAHEVLECGDGLPPEVPGILYHRIGVPVVGLAAYDFSKQDTIAIVSQIPSGGTVLTLPS